MGVLHACVIEVLYTCVTRLLYQGALHGCLTTVLQGCYTGCIIHICSRGELRKCGPEVHFYRRRVQGGGGRGGNTGCIVCNTLQECLICVHDMFVLQG